ncbi:MAG: 50S ribosomal protein L29 [Planctomycetota bacterium]
MKTSESRRLNDNELGHELTKARQDLLNLNCRIAIGEEIKPGELQAARKSIARILTIQRERTLEIRRSAETGSEGAS